MVKARLSQQLPDPRLYTPLRAKPVDALLQLVEAV